MKLSKKMSSSPMVSLTPLIDVVFILLIFFMLVSQFSQLQQQNLPMSQTSYSQPILQQQLIIKLIQKENALQLRYNVNNMSMNWPQLQTYLQGNNIQAVVLTPEPNISLQQFIRVKENLTSLGIKKITSELMAYEVN
jgi:biopolymer transport protein ExbD